MGRTDPNGCAPAPPIWNEDHTTAYWRAERGERGALGINAWKTSGGKWWGGASYPGCEFSSASDCATFDEAWGKAWAALCDFVRPVAERMAARTPPPEVVAAAAELRRLAETPTGRDAAKARAAWARHTDTCATCRPWAKAQSKAPRGKYLLAPECAESRRLMDATEAAEKVHRDAEEKRARLPLVLVAWIEGLA